jgi:hypothetical protein
LTAHNLQQQIRVDQTEFNALRAEYARVTTTFPKTPTSTENLKTTIKQYQILQRQTASPATLLLDTSKVLAGYPQVEIESFAWRIGKPSQEKTRKKTSAPPGPATPPAKDTPVSDLGYELATVSARVVGARRTDVRAITEMSSQFVDAFRKVPRLEVFGVKMPFDVTAEDSLRGDVGSERTVAEDARFSFTIGRRLGR